MKLALKKTNSETATTAQKLFSSLIKLRLVSKYSHSGVIVGDKLYHVTGAKGYQVLESWNPEHWDIFEIDGDENLALAQYAEASQPPKGKFQALVWKLTKGYDWFSLLAFVGPLVRVSWLNYCFELSFRMLTGDSPKTRVTSESLLSVSLASKAAKLSSKA